MCGNNLDFGRSQCVTRFLMCTILLSFAKIRNPGYGVGIQMLPNNTNKCCEKKLRTLCVISYSRYSQCQNANEAYTFSNVSVLPPRDCSTRRSFFRISQQEPCQQNITKPKNSALEILLTKSESKKSIKRGKRKSKLKETENVMFLLGNNAAGLGNKTESFLRNIQHFKPGVYFVQETKCKVKNKIKHDDYVLFEQNRKSKGGGGLLTAVHKSLEPMSINEDSDVEILVVQAVIGKRNVRLINGYGPQETVADSENTFFNQLDIEIKSSKMGGNLTCIQMDANSKLGYQFVPNDPNTQSRNGKLLSKVIINNDLIVVNGTNLCVGLITRFRKTVNSTERSVIDFFLVCREFFKMIVCMKVDEDRAFTLTKFSGKTGNKNMKESDHNMLELKINTKWSTNIMEKEVRTEVYNYKHTENFKVFQEATENNDDLKFIFDDEQEDLNIAANNWLSVVNHIIKASFNKIRIKKQRNSE